MKMLRKQLESRVLHSVSREYIQLITESKGEGEIIWRSWSQGRRSRMRLLGKKEREKETKLK